MTEAKFQTKFSRWWYEVWSGLGKFELKLVNLNRAKSMNYKAHLRKVQRIALHAEKLGYKIPDDGFAAKPCDFIGLDKTVKGFLVVQFWKRGVKHFYTIPYENIHEDIRMGFKSLNEERAQMLGTRFSF